MGCSQTVSSEHKYSKTVFQKTLTDSYLICRVNCMYICLFKRKISGSQFEVVNYHFVLCDTTHNITPTELTLWFRC